MSEERRFGHHDYKRVRRAHANLAGLDQQQCEAVLSLLLTERDAARRDAYREAAALVRLEAERIKHTSHRDGLGMGDLLTEERLIAVADDLARRATTDGGETPTGED